VNIQTIPRKDKVVKAAFVPKLDAFLFCDYPNIELKLLAFYLESIGWPSMADVFRAGADLHLESASGVFGAPPESLDDEQRQVGKTLNFSIVYGGGVPTLIEQGVAADGAAAMQLLRGYHGRWPGIGWESKKRAADHGTLIAGIKERVNSRGYITTLYGRHLHPRSMHSALNALCQGCAADLMKWAMVQVDDSLKYHGMRSHIVNMVHDELILDCAADELPTLAASVPLWMTDARIQAVVPIVPEPEVSFTTWADKHPYEGGTS
jgi:DNA polymerase-1